MTISEEMRQGILRMGKAASGIPDRVPIVAQINEHARKLGGYKAEEYYRNPEIFFKNQLLVSEYYGIDFPATEYYDLYNIEAEALGQPLIWFNDYLPEVDHKKAVQRAFRSRSPCATLWIFIRSCWGSYSWSTS